MSTKSTRRKHEDILNIIALYRAQPCLWNTNVEESKSAHARRQALEDIAESLNASVDDVRRKLHNLRSQYRREYRRMTKTKTGRPKWLYYNALKFLGSIKSVQCKHSVTDSIEDSSEEVSVQCEEDVSINNDQEINEIEQNHSHEIHTFREIKQRNRSSRKDTSNGVVILPRPSEQQDEYGVFGENVANELRSLESDKHLQHVLKCKILEAILDTNRAAYNLAPVEFLPNLNDFNIEEFFNQLD